MEKENPEVSVVIASIVGPPFIDECVESVMRQEDAPEFEVVVVDCHGEETCRRLQEKHPGIRILPQRERKTVPDLRRIGVEASRGRIVAIIEEHCLAAKDWIRTLVSAHDGSCAAVGGCVEDADYRRLRDWVTYFTEYNSYMPPVPDGPSSNLPGNNISFRREVLTSCLESLTEGYWEAYLYRKLIEDRAVLISEPRMIVYHRGPFNYLYYLRQRYLFSRAFAGAAKSVSSIGKRWTYILASPVLPVLLLGRMAHRVWEKKKRVGKFVACIPLLVPVSIVYIWGEVVGYIFGPGDSLMKVE